MHRVHRLTQHLLVTSPRSSPLVPLAAIATAGSSSFGISVVESATVAPSTSSLFSHPILTSIPRSILLLLANTYLTDVEVNRTARVAWIVLRTLNNSVRTATKSSLINGEEAHVAVASTTTASTSTTTIMIGYRIKKCLPLSYILSQSYREAVADGLIIGQPTSVFTSRNDHIGLNRLMNELPLSVKSITFRTSFLTAYSYTKDRSRTLPLNIKWPNHLTELFDVAFSIPIDQVKLPQQLKRLTFAVDAAKYSPDRSFVAPIVIHQSTHLNSNSSSSEDHVATQPKKVKGAKFAQFLQSQGIHNFPSLHQPKHASQPQSAFVCHDELLSVVSQNWPINLTHLRIWVNQSLNDVILPHAILSLEFGGKFAQPLNGFIYPPYLQQLAIITSGPSTYPHPLNDWSGLPQSCTRLYLNVSSIDQWDYDSHINWWHMDLSQVTIPEQIECLTLSFARSHTDTEPNSYQSTVNQLRFPAKMKELILQSFNQPLNEFIWNRDESTTRVESVDFVPLSLSLGSSFNNKIEAAYFPPNLTSLSLGSSYTGDIKSDKLPSNLLSINVGGRSCENRSISLPSGVESIYFGEWDSLNGFEFPLTTRFISLPTVHLREPLTRIRFPPSLTTLHLHNTYAYSSRSLIQEFLSPTGATKQLPKLHSITTTYNEYIPVYHDA